VAGGVPAQLLTGTALVDDLRTIELEKSDAIIFTARSPLPTYWQVATLATFDGTEWLPTTGVDAALAGAPAVTAPSIGPTALPTPAGGQQFSASVDVTAFASRLLPAPPHTVAVHGLHGAVVAPDEGVLAASPSRTGTRYRVTARLNPTGSTSPTQLDPHDPRLAPYLALPRQPAVVDFLAHAVVGRDTTPGAEVQDLVNWFRSGRFRYTLDPPSTGGSDPLVQFLTVTRAGYCQQFAGAFGVMARSLGIPTRLVVGFSTGQPGPGDSYTVTGADAHVWPQVYLGPGTGWVSVEPTPAAAGTGSGAAGVIGPAASQPSTPTTLAPATVTPATGSTRPNRVTSPPVRGRRGSLTTLPVLLLVALVAAAAAGAILYRRRGADRAGLPPDQRIVGAWERAHQVLRRHGLGRRPAETPAEYATRLRAWERQSARRVGADALGRLAALVELACYTPGPCTPGQADAALGCAAAVAAAQHRRRRRHRRSHASGELSA
jgi:transglutaminase-like putative cysteine protease